MTTIIKIMTKDNTITVTEDINFSPIELPYGAIGYRFNGSSTSPIENLNQYWNFVDSVLTQSNISNDQYVTLKSISINNQFYGISN